MLHAAMLLCYPPVGAGSIFCDKQGSSSSAVTAPAQEQGGINQCQLGELGTTAYCLPLTIGDTLSLPL